MAWVARRGRLELFLGLGRAMVSDRSGREALIGCGAALDHLRVATAAAGWQAEVSRFPDPNDPNRLASIAFIPMECVTDSQRSRASAIWARRTDRLPFIAPMNWEADTPINYSPSALTSPRFPTLYGFAFYLRLH
jgi:hypothetical protein